MTAGHATTGTALVGVTFDCSDTRRLAGFYRELIGSTETGEDDEGWVSIKDPTSQIWISFQKASYYRPPVWPPEPEKVQMMAHLEIRVDDLDAACALAESLGATQMSYQPQSHVKVYADPDGHPFCLFVPESHE